MIPVEHSRNGEIVVKCRRIGDVSHESIDPSFISWKPSRVKSTDDGGGVDEVAITVTCCQCKSENWEGMLLEMVIIVISVSEIYP